MPHDERVEHGDAVPVVGAERVTADAGGGLLRRLHNRTGRAAERGVRYARSRRQAGRANAAALVDGAAGNAITPNRCPTYRDRRAANGYRAPALAHGTTGHRDDARRPLVLLHQRRLFHRPRRRDRCRLQPCHRRRPRLLQLQQAPGRCARHPASMG